MNVGLKIARVKGTSGCFAAPAKPAPISKHKRDHVIDFDDLRTRCTLLCSTKPVSRYQ